ncbi:hypothetical protein ARAM_004369 [Aspergillus rambellii]|uniref:GPI-anchor biosynthesis protein n=1 Tax=Aspergillus rambellii TaxID=308745 RepID=A0A0F8X971_9EURO|nr:hypothetical protein ARAM_004369 [Aspergillus rambellii]
MAALTTAPASSSSLATPQAPPPATMKSKPAAAPVSILPGQFAQIYSFIHPALLLSLLVLRFGSVIDDPVTELLHDLPILVVLQVAFAMICLPPAGAAKPSSSPPSAQGEASTAVAEEKTTASRKIGSRRRHAAGKSSSSPSMMGCICAKLTPALLSLTLTSLLATPVLSILLILFGAPLRTHHALTLLCAAHMALLACFPLIYVHGVDGPIWREIWAVSRPVDSVSAGALGTCLGAWFGAVPIPLDWDRPWQAYPITILTGAYLGHLVGVLGGRSEWVFGKRIDFTKEERNVKVE